MQRSLPTLRNLFRSVLLLSALTAASAHAAEKIDLIIDTDPGADDVVALLFAPLAAPTAAMAAVPAAAECGDAGGPALLVVIDDCQDGGCIR